jgi:two-component system sensor histidine kinase SenX3
VTSAPVVAVEAIAPASAAIAVLVAVAAGLLAGWVMASRRALEHVRSSAIDAGVTVTDEAGARLEGVTGAIVRSLRDRDTARDSARTTGLLLKDALDGLPQGVLVVDDRGGVVERNAAAATFVTARPGDALIEAAIAELVAAALEGLPDRREVELFGPPRRVVLVEVAPITTTTGRAAVAVIEDVTERRHLEAVRRDFVANISHELKTPVGAIGLLAETMLGEDDPEVVGRLAGRIQSESLRVGRTIEDLLELSRIETSAASQADRLVVHELVEEAVSRIRPAAEQAGIAIDASGVDRGVVVRADRRQLTSAISNLLDNAVKYSDAGGSVEVAARFDGSGQVALSVADHGIGIPARDLERIFERFYRVDQGRSRQTGGTGLGLAIVRHIAANHDGRVEVESRLGEGSTFTLHLRGSAASVPPVERSGGAETDTGPTDAPDAENQSHAPSPAGRSGPDADPVAARSSEELLT